MLISDWSSDVCSSDLLDRLVRPQRIGLEDQPQIAPLRRQAGAPRAVERRHTVDGDRATARCLVAGDRKSVVSGMSVSVRVDTGGRRIITKNKTKSYMSMLLSELKILGR